MLIVHTSTYQFRGPERLDTTWLGNARVPTEGGHRGIGRAFMPPARLFWPFVQKRRRGQLTDYDWDEYLNAYTAVLRKSYRLQRSAWDTLLGWPVVVLVCFCPDHEQCHRSVLAESLAKTGRATYVGELPRGTKALQQA